MDILYFSNHCPHSQKLLPYLVKNQIHTRLNFVCVDRRERCPKTGTVHIVLENGTKVLLPPNVHRVPSLVLVKDKYRCVIGDDIYTHLQPLVRSDVLDRNGEPAGFPLSGAGGAAHPGGGSGFSESFSPYDLGPANGRHETMSLASSRHMPAFGDAAPIDTPAEQYKPDKLRSDLTIDALQQQRNLDLEKVMGPTGGGTPPLYSHMPFAVDGTAAGGAGGGGGGRMEYATMGVLPPTKFDRQGEGRGKQQMPSTTYAPINVAPKATAEDAREILFGRGSGWSGGSVETSSSRGRGPNGNPALPAPYLNMGSTL
jgi:hypothetical protein